MTVEKAHVIRRTANDEQIDIQQAFTNYENEEWRSWPNQGAVCHPARLGIHMLRHTDMPYSSKGLTSIVDPLNLK